MIILFSITIVVQLVARFYGRDDLIEALLMKFTLLFPAVPLSPMADANVGSTFRTRVADTGESWLAEKTGAVRFFFIAARQEGEREEATKHEAVKESTTISDLRIHLPP
jgi:hypothetical protein